MTTDPGLLRDALLVTVALAAAATDMRWRRIPNVLTFPVMLLGLVLGVAAGSGWGNALGLVLGLAVCFPLYQGGGLKAGDVKLMMAIGAIGGPAFLLVTALAGAVAGGLVAGGYVAWQHRRRGRSLADLRTAFIPYGVPLAAGVLVALMLTPR